MPKTIMCSFENTDMADIAAAKLREKNYGILDIEVIKNKYQRTVRVQDSSEAPFLPAANLYSGFAALGFPSDTTAFFINGDSGLRYENHGDNDFFEPSLRRDVLLKVVCNDSASGKVKAKLISAGATKITVQ